MATIDEIKQQAEAVKNATKVGENTAERVGGALAGLADIAKQQEDNIGKKADKETVAQDSESTNNKFGTVYETILESSVLNYSIDIQSRPTTYEITLLVTSNRIGAAPLYKTTNGFQDDGTNINIGSETIVQIPAGTTKLKFVRTGLQKGDIFKFQITEKSELRTKVEKNSNQLIEDNSIFINSFDVNKGTAFNPTSQIKKAVKWIKLYDYTDEFYEDKQIGLSECAYNNKVFTLDLWDYSNNKRLCKLTKDFPTVQDVEDAGVVVLGNRNTKVAICFDFTDFNFTLGGITAGTSINDYTHRGINMDKCIKDELRSLRSIFLPSASFVKKGFDITRMVTNSIKYLKALDKVDVIPNIGLAEFFYSSSTTILTIRLWDFTNNVELCKFSQYYTSTNRVQDVLVSKDGKWEISIDLLEMFFDIYSVTVDNLDSPFTYSSRGIDPNCIIIQSNITNSWKPKRITDYSDFPGGVIRTTTSKVESNTTGIQGFVYFPIKKGIKYRIIANDTKVQAPAWGVLAFCSKLPESGDSVTMIKSYDTDGYKSFDMVYTPSADGYLLASYYHSDKYQGTFSVYKFIQLDTENTITGNGKEYPTVFEGLSKGTREFKVGSVEFRAKTSNGIGFTPDIFTEQYEGQYAKYINNTPCTHYGRMITTKVIDMFEESLNAANFNNSYCRQLIGVDSEGFAYISQRFCMYDFETDSNTKILRTKDFVHFETFMEGVVGVQLIELENGELCFAANSTDSYDDKTGYYCNIYVTSNHKKAINKMFHTTRTSAGVIGQPWNWGIQSRGSIVAISEYGAHGKVGSVWYSRDFGKTFCHVFEHSRYAPNYSSAHIHGICIDPYFDRLYVITGDGGNNSRLYWWDYSGEALIDTLYNIIEWKYIETNMDCYTGGYFQFVCGYALKDCVILGSDGQRGGIYRINRTRKEDSPIIDFGVDFGYPKGDQFSTVWCGGNMFKKNDDSPLLICIHREASNDLEPNDANNPSHYANTYKTVLSKVYATKNGYDFSLLWEDDTYGEYDVWTTENMESPIKKNLAMCGRDMSIYQLPDNTLLLKYIGRSFSYISFNNNGKTDNTKEAYHRFNNFVVKGYLK